MTTSLPDTVATRRRWAAALAVGLLLATMAFGISFVLPYLLAGNPSPPWAVALVGIVQLLLMVPVLAVVRRVGKLQWRQLGITRDRLGADLLIGLAVAIAFGLLQFGLIIPATGGETRIDVVANLAQMAGGPAMVGGFAILAVLGGLAEELLFRGLLLHGLAAMLRRVPGGVALAVLLLVVLFGALHGYQGWAGVVDTAAYGGLTLSLLTLWRKGRIAAAMAAHAGWNAIAVTCLALLY